MEVVLALGTSPQQCWPWADTQKCFLEDMTTGQWVVGMFWGRWKMIRSTGLEEGLVSGDKVYATEKEGSVARCQKHISESWEIISLLLGDVQRALLVQTGHAVLSLDEQTHTVLQRSNREHDTKLRAESLGLVVWIPYVSSGKLKLSSPLRQARRSSPTHLDHLQVEVTAKGQAEERRYGSTGSSDESKHHSPAQLSWVFFFYHFELTKQAGFAHSFTKLFSLHKMNLLTGQNLEKLSIKHIKINQIRVLEMRFLEHITAVCSTEKNSVAANIFPPSQENIFN